MPEPAKGLFFLDLDKTLTDFHTHNALIEKGVATEYEVGLTHNGKPTPSFLGGVQIKDAPSQNPAYDAEGAEAAAKAMFEEHQTLKNEGRLVATCAKAAIADVKMCIVTANGFSSAIVKRVQEHLLTLIKDELVKEGRGDIAKTLKIDSVAGFPTRGRPNASKNEQLETAARLHELDLYNPQDAKRCVFMDDRPTFINSAHKNFPDLETVLVTEKGEEYLEEADRALEKISAMSVQTQAHETPEHVYENLREEKPEGPVYANTQRMTQLEEDLEVARRQKAIDAGLMGPSPLEMTQLKVISRSQGGRPETAPKPSAQKSTPEQVLHDSAERLRQAKNEILQRGGKKGPVAREAEKLVEQLDTIERRAAKGGDPTECVARLREDVRSLDESVTKRNHEVFKASSGPQSHVKKVFYDIAYKLTGSYKFQEMSDNIGLGLKEARAFRDLQLLVDDCTSDVGKTLDRALVSEPTKTPLTSKLHKAQDTSFAAREQQAKSSVATPGRS